MPEPTKQATMFTPSYFIGLAVLILLVVSRFAYIILLNPAPLPALEVQHLVGVPATLQVVYGTYGRPGSTKPVFQLWSDGDLTIRHEDGEEAKLAANGAVVFSDSHEFTWEYRISKQPAQIQVRIGNDEYEIGDGPFLLVTLQDNVLAVKQLKQLHEVRSTSEDGTRLIQIHEMSDVSNDRGWIGWRRYEEIDAFFGGESP